MLLRVRKKSTESGPRSEFRKVLLVTERTTSGRRPSRSLFPEAAEKDGKERIGEKKKKKNIGRSFLASLKKVVPTSYFKLAGLK